MCALAQSQIAGGEFYRLESLWDVSAARREAATV
jgi:hypothetical protein